MRPRVKRVANMAVAVSAPKKQKPRTYNMPDPLPVGEILTDMTKQQWSLGSAVGKGGFGLIYLASETKNPKTPETYVIKIEPHENGPLFCELHFYQRGAKSHTINDWKKNNKMQHLGVPTYIASGQHEHGEKKYRFLVMERFGEDLWNLFEKDQRRFSPKTAYTLAIQIVDSLEYLHSTGYAHADIKGANLLLGYDDKAKNQVFLVDFGLASRYMPNDEHREYKEEPKKAHDGTLEYTSRDAHNGVSPARRSDLEILGYVLIQWLAGTLPWEKYCNEFEVQKQKERYMKDIDSLLKDCFMEQMPPYEAELKEYLKYVCNLKYDEKPKYAYIKDLFKKSITASGSKCDGKLEFGKQKIMAKARVSPKKRIPRQSPVKKSKAKAQLQVQKPPIRSSRANLSPAKKIIVMTNGIANSSFESESSLVSPKKIMARTRMSPRKRIPWQSPVKKSKAKAQQKPPVRSSQVNLSPAKKRRVVTNSSFESESESSLVSPRNRRMTRTSKQAQSASDIESSVKPATIAVPKGKRTRTRSKVVPATQLSIATQTSPGLKGLRGAKKRKAVK